MRACPAAAAAEAVSPVAATRRSTCGRGGGVDGRAHPFPARVSVSISGGDHVQRSGRLVVQESLGRVAGLTPISDSAPAVRAGVNGDAGAARDCSKHVGAASRLLPHTKPRGGVGGPTLDWRGPGSGGGWSGSSRLDSTREEDSSKQRQGEK